MNITDYIYCPITKMIFNSPVVCEDGYTYEEETIKEWFINNNTSPLTNLPINKKYSKNLILLQLIDSYLNTYPEHKKDLYMPSKINFNMNEPTLYEYLNVSHPLDIKFSQIPLNIFKNNKIMKLIIDKHNISPDANNSKPIHFICLYSTPEMIKYIIDKGVDLEATGNKNWKPIHFICRYSTPEMIKYIIDKGVDLEATDNVNWKPIHNICRYSTPEMIKYIIDKGVNLEAMTNDNWKPIHLICQFSTPEMKKYIIDKLKVSQIENNIRHNICIFGFNWCNS